MAAKPEPQEVWELVIEGRVSVEVTDPRGQRRTLSEKGKGKRLRLSTADREICEERIRYPDANPFRNGMMIRVDGVDHGPSGQEISDDDLTTIFQVTGADFEEAVKAFDEVNVRRMRALAVPIDATRSQIEFLDELISERYSVGGSVPSYDELQSSPLR